MTHFQAISWKGQDIDGEYKITGYGRTHEGMSVSVSFPFKPYYFVRSNDTSKYRGKIFKFKDLWGFQNNEQKEFIKLNFDTIKDQRNSVWRNRGKVPIYESNIDPLLRFFHRTGIQSCGWVDASCARVVCETDHSIELECDDWSQLKPVKDDTNAPFRVMSFDLECYSHDGSFPSAEDPQNCIFQIGISTYDLGSNTETSVCLCIGDLFKTERELLIGFQKHLRMIDPDIITGWNIFGFDLEYLVKRMIITKCPDEAYRLGRDDSLVEVVEKKLSSSALGDNILKIVPMVGRYVFDLMGEIKREHKLENYKLDDVSFHFIGDKKIDMPPKELFRRFRENDGLDEVAKYCIQDTLLPIKLMRKLYTIENLIEMAKATWVPLSYLSERGQQIKVFSQLARKSRELGFLIPTFFEKNTEQSTFEGATVLEPECGAYYGNIMCLDFESLYPSIMMAHNLCYSTLVLDPKYLDIPGIEYEKHGEHIFAQGVPSLLPEILRELKTLRKQSKALMSEHKRTPMEHVYNGKQLAYKISMNSVYGFTGASFGILPQSIIASTVTRKGREMIEETKNYIEKHFDGAKVRYGDTDSVMVDFNVRTLEEAWKIGERASKECSQLFKSPNNLELENAYSPFILISKKRYFAKKITKNKAGEFVNEDISKGLQDVRRDTCLYVRKVLKTVQHFMLNSSDINDALKAVKEATTKLLRGDVDVSELYLSKQLKSGYKNENLAHVKVAQKMKERSPGSEPQQGDRVRYVIVKGPKKSKLYERSEDPEYAREHNIPIDYQYYFENQMKTPILDLLGSVVSRNIIFD